MRKITIIIFSFSVSVFILSGILFIPLFSLKRDLSLALGRLRSIAVEGEAYWANYSKYPYPDWF